VVARVPWLWGMAFYASRRGGGAAGAHGGLAPDAAVALRQLLDEPPDVLVSVIPMWGNWSSAARHPQQAAVIMVVSDLVSIHRAWLSPQADLVLVPTEPGAGAFGRYNVPAHKLRLVGYTGERPVSSRHDQRLRSPQQGALRGC